MSALGRGANLRPSEVPAAPSLRGVPVRVAPLRNAPQGAPLAAGLAPARPAPVAHARLPSGPLHEALRQVSVPAMQQRAVQHVVTARAQQAAVPAAVVQKLQQMADAGRRAQLRAELQPLVEAHKQAELARLEAIARGAHPSGPGASNPLDLLGVVNLAPVVHALATVKVPGLGGVAGKVGNELLDLPGQTFLSGAMAGQAASQVLQGNTAPGAQILKGVASQVEHPVRSFEQAPLSTALLLAGGEDALGRLVGGAGRFAGGDAVKALLSQDRAPVKLLDTSETPAGPQPVSPKASTGARVDPGSPTTKVIAHEQRYDPDPLRKAAQVAYEKALPHLPGSLRQDDAFNATGWRLQHKLIGGLVHSGRVDYDAAGMDLARRTVVKSLIKKAIGLKPAVGEDAVPLLVDGTIRANSIEPDLVKRLTKLQAARDGAEGELSKVQRKGNADSIKRVEGLLADKEFLADPSEAVNAARQYVRLQKPLTALRIVHGSLREAQTRARLFPYAISHMGARYFSEADHAALEDQALNVEKGAQARADAMAPGSPEHAAALKEVTAARAHRYEVSGRDGGPEVIAAHEQSIAEHGEARQAVVDAEKRVKQAQHARSRLTGARGAKRPARDTAVEGAGDRLSAAEARITGAKEALREVQGREREAMDAIQPKPKINAGLRTAEGKHLPDEEILAHAKSHGVDDIGFISHRPGRTAGSQYFQSIRRQPSLESYGRTGATFRKGAADHSFEGLAGHLAGEATKVAQHEGMRSLLNKYTIGRFGDIKEAEKAAEDFNEPDSDVRPELGGMRVLSRGSNQILDAERARGLDETPRDIKAELERQGLEGHVTPAQIEEAGKYGVIPHDVHARFDAHENSVSARSDWKRFFQAYTQGFRHVKFATSPHHALGILEENVIRPATAGAGYRSARLAIKFNRALRDLAETDKHGVINDEFGSEGAKAREQQGVLAGRGAQVKAYKDQNIVRKGDAWATSSPIPAAAERAGRSVPMKVWIGYRDGVEGVLAAAEHASSASLLGQALIKTGFLDDFRQSLHITDEGMRDLVNRKLTPNKVDMIARQLDRTRGNWSHLTPSLKTAVSVITPFGLWALNSAKWLATLPVTQPIKAGILGGVYQATRGQRNAEGQGYDAPGAATKEHPNYEQGDIPVTLPALGKRLLDLGHYSPLGVAGPEAGNTAAEQVLPQFSGILDALQGESPLTHEKAETAGGKELGGLAPFVSGAAEAASGPLIGATQLQQLLQHGGKPYGTANLITDLAHLVGGPAQVKPGTQAPLGTVLAGMVSPLKTFKADDAGASSAPASPREARAIERSEHTSTFAQRRLQRAVERSERR